MSRKGQTFSKVGATPCERQATTLASHLNLAWRWSPLCCADVGPAIPPSFAGDSRSRRYAVRLRVGRAIRGACCMVRARPPSESVGYAVI